MIIYVFFYYFNIGVAERYLECTWGGASCINFEKSKEKQVVEYCDTPDILLRFCKDFDKKNVDTDNNGVLAEYSNFSDPCANKELYFQDSETSLNCQKLPKLCGKKIDNNNKEECKIFELSLVI